MKQLRKRRRRLRKSVRQMLVVVLSVFILYAAVYYFLNRPFIGVKSQNQNAARYRNGNCLVFYPQHSQYGKEMAIKMCDGIEEKTIFDYQLEKRGDLYVVNYEKTSYLVNQDTSDIVYQQANESTKLIFRDYLIDALRQENRSEITTPSFYENINLHFEVLSLEGEELLIYYPTYQIKAKIPAKYVAKQIGLSLGMADATAYIPPYTINPEKPIICLTFDDGPNTNSTVTILDELDKYGAKATFYVVGSRFSEAGLEVARRGLQRGHEYGSHTYSHPNLTKLSHQEMIKEIYSPVNVFKDVFNYDMKTMRPPYGATNQAVKDAGLEVVLWTVDTEDWRSRNTENIFQRVQNVRSGDIVLFHDIFDETAEAVKRILPMLVEKGFQFVTISQLREFIKK